MIQSFDPESFKAFAQLLARPDPKDLPRRGHVYRFEGDPDRRITRLPGILMGWLQRRHLEVDAEEPVGTVKRTWKRRGPVTNSGLHVLRPTGTD